MILVFSRSKELNGINQIKQYLKKKHSDKFIIIESFIDLFLICFLKRNTIKSIFTLSDSDFIIAVAITQFAKFKIPIVSSVYHPKQWNVMLDYYYCQHRANIFKDLLKTMSANNVLFNSKPAANACNSIQNIGQQTIITAPIESLKCDLIEKVVLDKNIMIITVGRLVNFKMYGILRMIEIVDKLNMAGYNITYKIYGAGPYERELVDSISKVRVQGKIFFLGVLNFDDFVETVASCELFYGMGTAVVHAAMLKIPSLIAIQYEEGPYSYGWFCDHDHKTSPMFGDQTPGVPLVKLEDSLIEFYNFKFDEKMNLAERCFESSQIYDGEKVVNRLFVFINQAKIITYRKITLVDLVIMQLQIVFSRITGRKPIQA